MYEISCSNKPTAWWLNLSQSVYRVYNFCVLCTYHIHTHAHAHCRLGLHSVAIRLKRTHLHALCVCVTVVQITWKNCIVVVTSWFLFTQLNCPSSVFIMPVRVFCYCVSKFLLCVCCCCYGAMLLLTMLVTTRCQSTSSSDTMMSCVRLTLSFHDH